MHLYLDFDGVLHPFGELAIDECGLLLDNPNLFCWLPALAELLAPHPQVQIIVSSDWCRLFDDPTLMRLLGPLGDRFAGVVDTRGASRALEIAQDAQKRGLAVWLALDDHDSVRAAARRDRRYIPCHPDRGLADPAVQATLRTRLAQGLAQRRKMT